jgi:ribosomal protein S18 acetylase RimI-like enzyme
MTPLDLDQVKVLADLIHVDHPEDMDVLAERQQLYPQGCFVLAESDHLIGYTLTHPWSFGKPPPLNSRLREIPSMATTYYIHDLALLPQSRGRGHAAQAVELLAGHAQAAGFGNLSLVAVNNSQAFWERLGFRTMTIPGLEAKLFSYGPDAVLMTHDLTKVSA